MANWCDANLIVIGPRAEVIRLARDARSQIVDAPGLSRIAGRVTREPGPGDVFALDMIIGESNHLFAKRMKSLGQGLCQKQYGFDVRNDDGRAHFREVSRRYPALYFVLVYWDQSRNEYGSYLIRGGRSQWYLMTEDAIEAMFEKHGWDPDLYPDPGKKWRNEHWDNEAAYIDASWELMHQCEERWLRVVYKRLGIGRSPKR